MEKKLNSDDSYRLLFENNPQPMWIYDVEKLSFLDVNHAATCQYGYSRKEFLAMSVKDIYLIEDVPHDSNSLGSTVENGAERMEVCRHRKKDGTVINVEIISFPLNFGGRTAGLVWANDITERKRSEELYKILVDTIPSSVLLIDQQLNVTLANKNFLNKSRRLSINTVGKKLSEVFPEVILNELGLERAIREVFHSKKTTPGQRLTYRAPGVPIRVYYYNIVPLVWSSKVENVLLLMDDITEQIRLSEEVRRVERHLASVVESASDMVLSTDAEGRILTWNAAAEKISGFASFEVKGSFLYGFCPPDYHEKVKMFFPTMVLQKKSSYKVEWDLSRKNGSFLPVSWVFSPMKDVTGQIVGIVAVGRDLTEHRKYEMQLLQSQKLAALGVMAGGIAHEIRNPLAIASSAAQFLMEYDSTPEFQRECSSRIHSSVLRASTIIENLLRFARPAQKNEMEKVSLLAVLNDGLMLIANQAKIQNIELNSHFPEQPVLVMGIPGLLEQLFMNLFLNALNAMPHGGKLNICMEKDDSQASIRMVDTGEGISKVNIGNIFDPFYTKSRVGKGTGLGLSICYSIVKQHFGSIEVDSIEGKGSTFIVRLPLL